MGVFKCGIRIEDEKKLKLTTNKRVANKSFCIKIFEEYFHNKRGNKSANKGKKRT